MSSSVAPLRARAVNIIICKTEEEKHSCRFGGEVKDFSLRHVSGPARLDLWDFQKGGAGGGSPTSDLRQTHSEIMVLGERRLEGLDASLSCSALTY